MTATRPAGEGSDQAPGVRSRAENGVGWIVFDNPRRHNALTLDMFGELAPAIAGHEADPVTHVIVLAGAGERAFSTGGDISEFSRNRSTPEALKAYRETFRAGIAAIAGAAKPTIAAIRGYCLGGGMSMALACDLRFCTPGAQFCFPGARLGSAFDYASIKRVTALIGPAAAKAMLLTADRIDGREAERIGLANRCFPEDSFDEQIGAIAGALAANAPLSMAALKRAVDAAASGLNRVELGPVLEQLERCSLSEDHAEGRRAFAEKRLPRFRGR